MDEHQTKLLSLAKELTGSNDISTIIAAAERLRAFQQPIEPHATPTQPAEDILSFAEKCRVEHPIRGPIPFSAYPFQADLLRAYCDNNLVIVKHSRQMGISSVAMIYALYRATHFPNRRVMVMSAKLPFALCMFDRLHYMLNNSPIMVPPLVRQSRTSIEFNNGSMIGTAAVSGHSLVGIKVTDVIVDAADYINHSRFEEFWALAQPHFGNGTKFVIQSTPHSPTGLFYQLFQNADKMGAVSFNLPYSVHPERDDKWAQPYRDLLGEASFKEQFECQFVTKD